MKVLRVLDVMRVMQVDDARSVREWFRSGRLKGVNLGGRLGWRCTEEQLRDFMESNMSAQPKLTGLARNQQETQP